MCLLSVFNMDIYQHCILNLDGLSSISQYLTSVSQRGKTMSGLRQNPNVFTVLSTVNTSKTFL